MTYYNPPKLKIDIDAPETLGNVAALMEADDRRTLATHLIELIAIDDESMSEWLGKARGYLDRVDGENENAPQSNMEQDGSNENTQPPSTALTLSSVIQFSARAVGALLGEPDLFKASEPGGEPLAAWLSSQVRTKDQNWVLDTDPLIVHMAVTGLSWRKRKFEREDQAFFSRWLTCDKVKINAKIISVPRAPRITEEFTRYPYEIERSILRKHWVDYEPCFDDRDPQAEKNFYECDAWLDLDGDDVVEPWIFTISRDDVPEVVKIEPRWSSKTIVNTAEELFFKPPQRYYPYIFLPDPKGGFLPKGFGWLLERAEAAADRLLASIIDTAETEAENGGVVSGNGSLPAAPVELKGNRITSLPGEGRPVDQMFSAFPNKSVSSGSVAVLDKTITLGDRLAGTLNLLENAPASMTATLAKGLIDNGTQVQSAVHRRLCSMLTQEGHAFVQMADAYDQLPEDLKGSPGIEVTADPQLATEMQRGAMGNLYMELIKIAIEAPGTGDVAVLWQRLLKVLRIPNPEELAGKPVQPQLSPDEKLKGIIALGKDRNDRIKAHAQLALNISQALKNLVDAQAGTIDIRTATLNMAMLEHAMQQLVTEAGRSDIADGSGSVAEQPGNAGAPAALPPPQAGGGDQLSGGDAAGAGGAGPGSGLG